MKLPWDEKYLKISFHVILTLVAAYILINVVDLLAFILIDIGSILSTIFGFLGSVIRVFSPLIIAFVIAYLLDPFVEFYQGQYENFIKAHPIFRNINFGKRKKLGKEVHAHKNRMAGALLTYLTVFVAIYILMWALIRNFDFAEDGGFMAVLNTIIDTITTLFNDLQTALTSLGYLDILTDSIDNFISWVSEYLLSFVNNAVGIVAGAGTWILNVFIALVVAFFFMSNKHQLIHQIQKIVEIFLPAKVNRFLGIALEDFHVVFSGYIRGLILDGVILGTLIAIGLSFIGVDLAILIGILTAIFNLIPFFGGIMAFFLSVSFELLLGSPITALYAGILILIIQQIDTVFIVPRVVGQRVKLSAPVVILSLSIAGSVFGIWGMLLIVPCIAIAKVFFTRFTNRYIEWKKKNNRTM